MKCVLCGLELSAPELCPQCGSLEGLQDDDVPVQVRQYASHAHVLSMSVSLSISLSVGHARVPPTCEKSARRYWDAVLASGVG